MRRIGTVAMTAAERQQQLRDKRRRELLDLKEEINAVEAAWWVLSPNTRRQIEEFAPKLVLWFERDTTQNFKGWEAARRRALHEKPPKAS